MKWSKDMNYHRNQKYDKFTEETKRNAVKRVLSGETKKTVSRAVGCSDMTIHSWVIKYGEKL